MRIFVSVYTNHSPKYKTEASKEGSKFNSQRDQILFSLMSQVPDHEIKTSKGSNPRFFQSHVFKNSLFLLSFQIWTPKLLTAKHFWLNKRILFLVHTAQKQRNYK